METNAIKNRKVIQEINYSLTYLTDVKIQTKLNIFTEKKRRNNMLISRDTIKHQKHPTFIYGGKKFSQ